MRQRTRMGRITLRLCDEAYTFYALVVYFPSPAKGMLWRGHECPVYAFYAFYAWWIYFPQSGALAEGTSLPVSEKHDRGHRLPPWTTRDYPPWGVTTWPNARFHGRMVA
jgi:hypothetical protein